jgi:nitrile hydratase accessory protein
MSHDSKIADALIALPLLPRDDQGPVFAEPWQAQVFALVVQLNESDQLTWAEWAECLGAQFRAAEERGQFATGENYYDHWLDALETLAVDKGLTAMGDLEAEREAIRADDHHRRDGQLHDHEH